MRKKTESTFKGFKQGITYLLLFSEAYFGVENYKSTYIFLMRTFTTKVMFSAGAACLLTESSTHD